VHGICPKGPVLMQTRTDPQPSENIFKNLRDDGEDLSSANEPEDEEAWDKDEESPGNEVVDKPKDNLVKAIDIIM
jgi:hypothetical protein